MSNPNVLIDYAGEQASDKADWIEQEADDLFYKIDRHQAYEIIHEVLVEGEQAYIDVVRSLSHWITCYPDEQTSATNSLVDALQNAMRPALKKMAEEKWGDA